MCERKTPSRNDASFLCVKLLTQYELGVYKHVLPLRPLLACSSVKWTLYSSEYKSHVDGKLEELVLDLR